MLRNGIASTAALAALLLTHTAQAAELADADCWRAEETKAAQIQNLKTMLMIDALKCQDTVPATVTSYNGFLEKRRDVILSSKARVREHFLRLLGPTEGYKASDSYDTRVGNRIGSAAIDPQRCETTAMYARLAATATEEDLVGLAQTLAGDAASDAEVAPCRTGTPVATRPARMVIPVWEQKAPAFAHLAPATATAPALPNAVTPTVAVVAAPAVAQPVVAGPVADVAAVPVAAPAAATTIPAVAIVPAAPEPVMAPAPLARPADSVAAVPAAVPAAISEAPAASRAETLKALQVAAAALAQIATTLQSDATPIGKGPPTN